MAVLKLRKWRMLYINLRFWDSFLEVSNIWLFQDRSLVMVKPRSLDVERSLRGSPRIENLKEEGVLESIARKWDLDVLITIWLEQWRYTTVLSWQCQPWGGYVAVKGCDLICRRLYHQHNWGLRGNKRRSFIKIEKRVGASIDPWGTPRRIGWEVDRAFPTLTDWYCSRRCER